MRETSMRPTVIYIAVWLICLFLFCLRLISYDALSVKAILLIALSLLGFAAGALIPGKRALSPTYVNLARLEKWVMVLFVASLTGVFLLVRYMAANYSLVTYFVNPMEIRADFDSWTTFHSWTMGIICIPLYVFCATAHRLYSGRWRWFTALSMVLPLPYGILMTDRSTILVLYGLAFFAWAYVRSKSWRDREVLRFAVGLGLIGITYFIGIGSLLGKISNPVYDSPDVHVNAVVAAPYHYAASNFVTFSKAIEDVHQLTFGKRLFYVPLRLAEKVGLVRNLDTWVTYDFYDVPIPANTYTHLFVFYQDFGSAGVVVIPFLLGLIQSWLYRRRPTLFSVGMSAIFAVINCFSVFITLIVNPGIWFFTMLLAIISFSVTEPAGFLPTRRTPEISASSYACSPIL